MKIVSSSVTLRSMRFFAHHGVMEQERQVGCHYVVDVSLSVDCAAAAASDELADALNYAEAYDVVRCQVEQSSHLIEHVAGRVARALLDRFPQIEELTVCVLKQNPPLGADVGSASVRLTCRR